MDMSYYSLEYNKLNNTNYKFNGDITIYNNNNSMTDFVITVHLIVKNNNDICYDFSREFFVVDGIIPNAPYNSKTITMNQYHLINIVDDIIHNINSTYNIV